MDINLPTPRSVFFPKVPGELQDFSISIQKSIGELWDNDAVIRDSLVSVTTGTVTGIVAVTNATTGDMLAYTGTGWDLIGAGADGQVLNYSTAVGYPVWLNQRMPPASGTGELLVSLSDSWGILEPGSSGQVLALTGTAPGWSPFSLTGMSPVVLEVHGFDGAGNAVACVTTGDISSTVVGKFLAYVAKGGSAGTLVKSKFLKLPYISTLQPYFRGGIGALNDTSLSYSFTVNTVTSTGSIIYATKITGDAFTCLWNTLAALDVSTLSNGTYYDMSLSLKGEGAGNAVLVDFVVFATS